jgi:DNA (cytosine-5)-methyltransferase 1
MDVVDVALPDVVLLENVRGLAYRGKDEGMRLIRGEFARINRRRGTDYRPQELQSTPPTTACPSNVSGYS